jgi:hypothetical protein
VTDLLRPVCLLRRPKRPPREWGGQKNTVLVSRVSANFKANPVELYTLWYQGAKLVQTLRKKKIAQKYL